MEIDLKGKVNNLPHFKDQALLPVDKALRENGGEPENRICMSVPVLPQTGMLFPVTAISNRALIIRPDTWVSLKVTSLKKVSLRQN